jgi:hypothetical protein
MSVLRSREQAAGSRRDRRCFRVNGAVLSAPAIAMDESRQYDDGATHPGVHCRDEAEAAVSLPGDCESEGRARERGAACQHAHALVMQTPGQEAWPRGCSASMAGAVERTVRMLGPDPLRVRTGQWRWVGR